MAAAYKFVHGVRADKTGAARNKVAHAGSPPSSCGRPAAGYQCSEQQIAAAAMDAGPGKTTGPRFGTLIVRGEPANEAG